MTTPRESAAAWLHAYLAAQGGHALSRHVHEAAQAAGYTTSTTQAGRLAATAPWISLTRHARDSRQTVWSLVNTPPAARGNQVPTGLDTDQATAYRWFMDTVEDNHGVPCRTDKHRHAWTSPHPEDQEYASKRCTGCPIRVTCHDYATKWNEKGGVWGGRKPSPTQQIDTKRKVTYP